jgi:hypothetical protein
VPKPLQAVIPGQELPQPVIISFGGGKNSRVRPLDIDINECTDGSNFDLDIDQLSFRRRKAFDLVATAPNAGSINGYAQFIPTTGVVAMLIQAGGNVYSWDGASSFTLVGTCSSTSKLRGSRSANFPLNGHVLVTDLNLMTNVSTWDDTTFADLVHNLTGTFQAKFCHTHLERAIFANVVSNGTATPHVVLASAVDDDGDLTTGNRPSSAIGADSSWFLTSPDLKPINGLEHGFGQLMFSTVKGSLHRLTGSSSFDFALEDFYSGSNVAGDESLVNIGNDIVMALPGRIETLSGTINFGDVETDDLSRWIKPDMENTTNWTVAYDQRLQKVYFFPNNLSQVFVLHKSLLSRSASKYQAYEHRDIMSPGLSPWSIWKTAHTIGFQPTTVWSAIDPVTGLDRVYMGDGSGRIYRLDGSGSTDGSTASVAGSNITASRTSAVFRVPDAEAYDLSGWITYAKAFATTVTLTFLWGGITQFDQAITLNLPTDTAVPVYNGNAYYGGPYYYNASFGARLTRQNWKAAGYDSHLQCKVDITGSVDFNITEIGLRFSAVNQQSGQKR